MVDVLISIGAKVSKRDQKRAGKLLRQAQASLELAAKALRGDMNLTAQRAEKVALALVVVLEHPVGELERLVELNK